MSRRLWIAGIIPALIVSLAIASALASGPADAALDVQVALAGSEPGRSTGWQS